MQGLFLHVWGLRQTVWSDIAGSFSIFNKVNAPCLYKLAREAQDTLLDSVAYQLKDAIVEDTVVIAWSIGGLVALPLAELTNKIKAIVFIASSPCFVNKEGWNNVIDRESISALKNNLSNNTHKTLEYFSGLVAHGDIKAKETNRLLRKHMACDEDHQALSDWLDQMLTTDKRNGFLEIDVPILVILGEKDSLINTNIETDLKSLNKTIEIQTIKNCGHAPFLTGQQEVSTLIDRFINAKLG